MPFHGGLDWGATSHAACVVDGAGQIVARVEARHDAGGLAELLARLRAVAPPAELPVAIERPSGLIVDALVAAGHPVVAIHPNVVKACRPRYRAAGGKSDPGDAYMLADVLRTDGHRFRPLTPVSDEIKALRALVRARDDLVTQRMALAIQLRSLLEGFWPGAAATFPAIDSPIALAFVGRYPTPEGAGRLGEKRLASFMAQHGYCGRRSAAELLARLRAAPTGLAGEAEADAKGEITRVLAGLLERLVAEIAKLSSRIERAVADLPDGRIIMSFPRAGRLLRGPDPGRDRRRARALPDRGPARRRGRCPSRHPRVRQEPRRRVPVGLRQEPAPSRHLLRRQLPPRLRSGGSRLRQGPRPRLPARPRRPRPRPRLDTCPLARLAEPEPLRSSAARRRYENRHLTTPGWTQGVSRVVFLLSFFGVGVRLLPPA